MSIEENVQIVKDVFAAIRFRSLHLPAAMAAEATMHFQSDRSTRWGSHWRAPRLAATRLWASTGRDSRKDQK
jgi:hypothetical protein